jgi:hypothetical protein
VHAPIAETIHANALRFTVGSALVQESFVDRRLSAQIDTIFKIRRRYGVITTLHLISRREISRFSGSRVNSVENWVSGGNCCKHAPAQFRYSLHKKALGGIAASP